MLLPMSLHVCCRDFISEHYEVATYTVKATVQSAYKLIDTWHGGHADISQGANVNIFES